MDKYHLSKTEREVMEKLWLQKEKIKQTQLLELFLADGKEWQRQTLNTLLARLEEKGYVKREHRLVWAVYDQKDFEFEIMQDALKNFYGGKISRFIETCVAKKKISKKEFKELQRIVQENVTE